MITDDRIEIHTELSFGVLPDQKTGDRSIELALQALETTSRTFFIPISRLPSPLLEAVASGYLCMRAIDEIEDHPELDCLSKVLLLGNISRTLQTAGHEMQAFQFLAGQDGYRDRLPEVTVRLDNWVRLAPRGIAGRIWDATAAMADRMASWVANGWTIQNEADLDSYTFGVAGAVGLMLSDIWAWYDGTRTDRFNAIGFGRGLQSVNILRNREADLSRGVDFFPPGWETCHMHAYARRNLALADLYMQGLPAGPVQDFCRIPLALAYATVEALEQGRSKLSRSEVSRLVEIPADANSDGNSVIH